jgi:mitochondrial fission protein ELM1
MSPQTPPILWIATEGLKGTENQCIGVAEALGIQPVIKKITLRHPWKLLSPYLGFESTLTFSEPLTAPWPDILIASGRKSIAISRYIKKHSKGKTFTVQIQDPRVNPKQFDLVAVPEHDPTRGNNVIVTVATPNRITAEKLEEAKTEFAHLFSHLTYRRVATKRHRFTTSEAQALAEKLSSLSGLMITTSRRTGDEATAILKDKLNTTDNYFYDGISPNPYMAMLATADVILVTADSTSMISEAATTGKPVYVIPMQGLTQRQQQLIDNFEGKIEHWTYPKLADSAFVAEQIRQKCGLFQ